MNISVKVLVIIVTLLYQSHHFNVVRRDPFFSLLETLQTQQTAACDGDNLILECPPGTKISIQLVIYGRSAPSHAVCPPTGLQPKIFTGREKNKCQIKEAVMTVEGLCQGKQSCSILTSAHTFDVSSHDPCPGVRKYAEVAYKCKPTSFNTRTLCGGQSMEFSCSNTSDRLAIQSSSFQSVSSGNIYCPLSQTTMLYQKDKHIDEIGQKVKQCENTEVTPVVTDICHGERSCIINADYKELEAPACKNLHVFLKTTYTCVNSEVFLQKYTDKHIQTDSLEKSSHGTFEEENDISKETYNIVNEDGNQYNKAVTETKLSDSNYLINSTVTKSIELSNEKETNSDKSVTDSIVRHLATSIIQIHLLVKTNLSRALLVFCLSIGLGMSGFLMVVIVRLCRRRKGEENISSSGVNLDQCDLMDYDITYALDPLPEPKIMQCPEDDLNRYKFSSLKRQKQRKKEELPKFVPIDAYSPDDCSIRYSTIGRGRGGAGTARSLPTNTSPIHQGGEDKVDDNYLYY